MSNCKSWRSYKVANGTGYVVTDAEPGAPGSKFNEIAQIYGPNAASQARLIAAAPEMLAALREVAFGPMNAARMSQVRAAIAKAEGR